MSVKRASVTLKDIADELGLSTATVSLALRNKECVALNTRRKVWEATQRRGYVYNRSAARLRTQKSLTIGLIVPNILNPFFTELTSSVEEAVETFGYSLLLAKTSEDREKQSKAIRTMLEYNVEGVLLCPALGTQQEELRICERTGTPLVLFTRPVDGCDADYVGPDNFGGTTVATRYLIKKGHRHIAFIGGTLGSFTRWERYEGYCRALKEANLPLPDEYNCVCETTVDGGYRWVNNLMQLKDPPTAAVCFNDVVAYGVILGLWANQLVPGKDFDVVGFDNTSDASLFSPSLSTVSCPPNRIGKKASELLLERIQNPEKRNEVVIFSPELILRESA
ncbi:MAG: LacI family DNA-binding transcriptional regulator [Spirochaetales bacterium]